MNNYQQFRQPFRWLLSKKYFNLAITWAYLMVPVMYVANAVVSATLALVEAHSESIMYTKQGLDSLRKVKEES